MINIAKFATFCGIHFVAKTERPCKHSYSKMEYRQLHEIVYHALMIEWTLHTTIMHKK